MFQAFVKIRMRREILKVFSLVFIIYFKIRKKKF